MPKADAAVAPASTMSPIDALMRYEAPPEASIFPAEMGTALGLMAATALTGCGDLNLCMHQAASEPLSHFDQSTDRFDDTLCDTVSVCSDNGGTIGARIGCIATAIPDALVGDGYSGLESCSDFANYHLKREGIVGVAAHMTADASCSLGMMAGGAAGLCVGAAVSPIVEMSGGDTGRAMSAGACAGANIVGGVVGTTAGSLLGGALAVPRTLSAITKLACAGAGALAGAAGGLLFGVGRGTVAAVKS